MLELTKSLPTLRGQYRPNALLSATNWFQVGGPADVLFRPADEADLADFLRHKDPSLPYMPLGVGSNLLVRDGGIEGVVIKLGQGFTGLHLHGTTIEAGAGCLGSQLAKFAQTAGLRGLEFLIGIPGTVGGALAMNAGAYGSEIKDFLIEATVIDPNGIIHTLTPDEIGYVYRGQSLPEGWIFTKGLFQLSPDAPSAIGERMETMLATRAATQPVKARTSGSTFKNPPITPDSSWKAWELIDKVGLRGKIIGGAQFSEKHCNFMLNLGNATAADLEALGMLAQALVFEQTGISLEWEIIRVGRTELPTIIGA
jgi:UDP-N-acetylmuramate dehydrogenase